jgi:hypothetical protein
MSLNYIDNFPSQGNKTTGNKTRRFRSSSALSSQSSASAGSRSPSKSVQREISNGDYLTSDCAVLRPYLKCFCETCGSEWLREHEWTMRCEKACSVKKGTPVRVVQSKVVHHKVGHKHERFSIALIEMQDPYDRLRGWVMSKTLKVRGGIRSESALRQSAYRTANRSRSRSVSVATSVQESVFQYGELVLVQTQGGDWVDAEIKSTNPLRVNLKGHSEVWPVHIEFVKKYPARKFMLTQDVKVRSTEKVDNWKPVATLKKGTVVSITHMSGYEGRITAPVCGWVTMRSKHSLNMISKDWKFAEQKPTIIVENLPSSMTRAKLTRALAWEGDCGAEVVEFQRKGNEMRAFVQVDYPTGCQLVDGKTLDIFSGWTVTFKWSMGYLQNRAASNLVG